jgi:hypothetical protein
MTTPLIISAQTVRDYLDLNSPGSQSSYSDATIGSNIRSALDFLEHRTGRFLHDLPATTWVIPGATMLRAQVAIPGFRNFTSVTWGGSALTVGFQAGGSASCWAVPDLLNSGIYVALQFRAWRADSDRPWWLADSQLVGQGARLAVLPRQLGRRLRLDLDAGRPRDRRRRRLRNGIGARQPAPRRQGARGLLHAAPAIDPRGRGDHPRWRHPQLLPPPFEVVDFIADWKLGGDQAVSM